MLYTFYPTPARLRLLLVVAFAGLCLIGNRNAAAQDTNLTEFINEVKRIGQQAVEEQIRQMRSDVREAGRAVDYDGRYWVTPDLISFRDIPSDVIARIEGRKEAIKKIIWETALEIENNRAASISRDDDILTKPQQERRENLSSAISKNNVSIRSLSLAIQMVVSITEGLSETAISEQNPERKLDLYIEYTATAYELSSIVLELLETASQEGSDELRRMYEARFRSVDEIKGRLRNRLDVFEIRLQDGTITRADYDEQKEKYESWGAALDETLKGWERVFEIVGEQKEWTTRIKSNAFIFRDQRDDAGLQLDILAEIGIAQAILLSLQGIEEIMEIAEIPLLPIDAELVRELLGFSTQIIGAEN